MPAIVRSRGLPPAPPALLDPAGAPVLGAFAGAHAQVDLALLARPGPAGWLRQRARAKRWVYALAISDEVLAAVAIVEGGYFGGGFAWAQDRRSGALLFEASAAGLPGRHARVSGHGWAGARARLATGALAAELRHDGAVFRLCAAGRGGFELDAVLDPFGAPAPFTFVAPVGGGGLRATSKAACLAARGTVRVGGRTLRLDGGSGGLDFTAGILARDTSWRWAFATGRAAGAPLGFNLCEGFGVAADDSGENAGFSGRPYRLPPVAFTVGGATAPWRIAGGAGSLELLFHPTGAHAEARNLGLVRTRFVQVAGTFEGRVPGPDGEAVPISALPGVVEDHRARW